MADSSGNWSLPLPTGFGSTTITVTATLGRSTGYSQLTVINVALPGHHGVERRRIRPATTTARARYQYPTDARTSRAGSFDLTRPRPSTRTGRTSTSRSRIREPGRRHSASVRRSAARRVRHESGSDDHDDDRGLSDASTTRSPRPTPGASGSRRRASRTPSGSGPPGPPRSARPQFVADGPTRTATLIMPRGGVRHGRLGVDVHGGAHRAGRLQHRPGARPSAATPQPFQFGVCAPGGTATICSFDPNSVPKVMDTITPSGVSQATELDPTLGSVVLQGVTVPPGVTGQ